MCIRDRLTRSRTDIRLTIEGAELYPFVERSIIQYRAMQEKANEIKGLEPSIKYTFHDDYAIMTMVDVYKRQVHDRIIDGLILKRLVIGDMIVDPVIKIFRLLPVLQCPA